MALPKTLYNKARKLDVVAFMISIEGGSDQAYLNAELEISEKRLDGKDRWTFVQGSDPHKELLIEIEEFGWEEHGHSGAGEGSAYGDRFRYDLVNKPSAELNGITHTKRGCMTMTPWKHSESTVARWGGKASITSRSTTGWMKPSSILRDWRHRALRHHSAGAVGDRCVRSLTS